MCDWIWANPAFMHNCKYLETPILKYYNSRKETVTWNLPRFYNYFLSPQYAMHCLPSYIVYMIVKFLSLSIISYRYECSKFSECKKVSRLMPPVICHRNFNVLPTKREVPSRWNDTTETLHSQSHTICHHFDNITSHRRWITIAVQNRHFVYLH